jgi:hypothetical protein
MGNLFLKTWSVQHRNNIQIYLHYVIELTFPKNVLPFRGPIEERVLSAKASQPLRPTHICDPHISVPNAFVRHAFIPHISVPRNFLTLTATQSLLHSSLLVVAAQVAASKLLPHGCCHAAAVLGLLPQGCRHKAATTPSSGIGVAK